MIDNKRIRYFSSQSACLIFPNRKIVSLRAAVDHTVLVSTSRHVTQGMIDTVYESFSGNTHSGCSRVVANDPYELRIAGLKNGKGWKFSAVTLSADDTAAGVKIEPLPQNEAGWLRLRITSPVSRSVEWEIEYN